MTLESVGVVGAGSCLVLRLVDFVICQQALDETLLVKVHH